MGKYFKIFREVNSISGFLLRTIINSIVLFAIVSKLPGMTIDTLGATLLGVVIVGLANAFIRPLLSFLLLGFFGLTGFTLLVNILVSLLVIKILPGFEINIFFGFYWFISVIFLTLCSVTLTRLIKDR